MKNFVLLSLALLSFVSCRSAEPKQNWEWLLEPQFEEAESFSDGVALVSRNGKRVFIDTKGDVVFEVDPACVKVGEFSEGLAMASLDELDKTYGYIDKTGAWAIEPQFFDAFPFRDGVAIVIVDYTGDGSGVPVYDWIDAKGNRVPDPNADKVAALKPEQHEDFPYSYGFVDVKGQWVIEPQFAYASKFVDGLARVRDEETKHEGLIDTTGAWVVEPKFHEVSNLFDSHGLAMAQLVGHKIYGGNWGFIDKAGAWVIEPKFVNVSAFNNRGIAVATAKVDGKGMDGFIDTRGTWLVEPTFSHADPPNDDGIARVVVSGNDDGRNSGYIILKQ